MKCSEDATAAALDLAGLPDEETTSGCFEFHHRTRSFDFHQSPSKHHKLAKLANLLRSRSDGNVRSSHSSSSNTGHSPRGSPRASPHGSPGPSIHRRFKRVVRDSQEDDLESPYVIHKYSPEYLSNFQKSSSVEEHQNCSPPYTVTGHTILKKQPLGSGNGRTTSVENVPESSPTLLPKHASFRDEVEIMEYDKKEKVRRGPLAKHKVRLHDSPFGSTEEEESEGVEPSEDTGEGASRKRVTFSDSRDSAASLDVPSEHSEFDHIFTHIKPPPESLKSSGHSESSGEVPVSPHATPPILSDKPNDDESQRNESDTISESLQKLSIDSSNLAHPLNTGPT